jgi:hypothetical protein
MKKYMAATILLWGIFLLPGNPVHAGEAGAGGNGCIVCHGDAARMKQLGFPQLTVTREEAQAQTGMPASCPDCHLGNPSAAETAKAHEGLLRLLPVKSGKLEATTRDRLDPYRPPSLEPREGNLLTVFPSNLLFHDKDPATLSTDYPVLEKTCGKCHPDKVAEFRKTPMGRNARQSRYKTWTDSRHGPHNCGAWFIDGYQELAANTALPYDRETALVNQKACNTCHVGCLDCHYSPRRKEAGHPSFGAHTFTKAVAPLTCYGGGRGFRCHSGPEDRRRGAGYIGGDFANPKGIEPDVHYSRGILCTDCHDTNGRDPSLLHGQVKREAGCTRCHDAAVRSVAASLHKNVSCEACHISNVGGYAATFWGPGETAGVRTPFTKYKNYYGVMKEPILIRDPKGKWIPVKPYAMAVMNQKSAGGLKPGLAWRWEEDLPGSGRTGDAYGVVGLLSGLPENGNALSWIQMDKVSHKYGKARECGSCHGKDGLQRQDVAWTYDDQGATPFSGGHTVIADNTGLSIRGMRADSEIRIEDGHRLSDFAPWSYLGDAWRIKGDFSIPPVKDPGEFEKELRRYDRISKPGGVYHAP